MSVIYDFLGRKEVASR